MQYSFVFKRRRNKQVAFSMKTTNKIFSPRRFYTGQRVGFQKAMMLTIVVGQCFGLNPVIGVTDNDASKMRFSYFSGRCAYAIIVIFGQIIFLNSFCIIKYFNETETSITSHATLAFYVFNTITTIIFLRIAKQWPKLCQYIYKVEVVDPMIDTRLIRKCNMSCIIILVLATLEHILSEISGLVMAADCHPDKIYETFIFQSFPWINLHVNYTLTLGILTQFLNVLCTFNWNYGVLFIISISLYLISRLEQINEKLCAVKGKNVSSSFWRMAREEYNRATDLVRRVDHVIGSVTFITFANNLVFICMQLLHTVALLRGYEHAVYFTYSFVFLVLRALAVSLVAAQVHTASRQPVYTLYEVPSATYCVEVQRFIDQIHGDTVALTGLQFFNVKRGIVLAIAGTIITYELVLLQFTGITPTVGPLPDDVEYKE